MVGKEILNEVYEFIKNNRDRNQSDIVRGLKKVCTRLPVLDAINELTSDKDGREPKVKFSRNTPKGFYHYYLNDKNDYNNLMALIGNLERLANKQETILSENYVKLQRIKNTSVRKNIHNLLFLGVIYFYFHLTGITVAINARIKNADDQQSLHMRLIKSIMIGSRMNTAILPLVNFDLESLHNNVEQGDMSNDLIRNLYGLVDELKRLWPILTRTNWTKISQTDLHLT